MISPRRDEPFPSRWQENVPLGPLTTLGVGGPARWLVEVASAEAVRQAVGFANDRGLPWWVLGGGSNVVIADAGLPGVVLRPVDTRVQVDTQGNVAELRVGAGLPWDELVKWTVERGLFGLECLSGIPGLVGAAPIQNIGAYGQEVAETLARVEAWEVGTGRTVTLEAADCAFAYRDSRFKREPGRYVVTAVVLRLGKTGKPCLRYEPVRQWFGDDPPPDHPAGLLAVRHAVLALRRQKSMLADPDDPDARSCGSFFTNPIVTAAEAEAALARLQASLQPGESPPRWPAGPGKVKLSAAWLIERSGLHRGYGEGPVGLSRRHTLALVNRGDATAADVLAFEAHVRERVLQATGVRLEREPVLLGAVEA